MTNFNLRGITSDVMLALALEHGCVICTYEKHFQAIDGLICGYTLSELVI